MDRDPGKQHRVNLGLCLPGTYKCLGMDGSKHTWSVCQAVSLGKKAGLFMVLDNWRMGRQAKKRATRVVCKVWVSNMGNRKCAAEPSQRPGRHCKPVWRDQSCPLPHVFQGL